MWRALYLSLLMITAPLAAQPVAKTTDLAWLIGDWTGEGQMFGRPSTARLSASHALGGTWVQLDYSVRVAAISLAPAIAFDGRGMYRASATGRWSGRWTDSYGASHPLAGRVTGQRLVSTWGSVDTEIGRTSYEVAADGTLGVIDQTLQPDGSWRQFARALFRKSGN